MPRLKPNGMFLTTNPKLVFNILYRRTNTLVNMHIPNIALFSLLAPAISATPVFKNHGTLDGWDGINHEHKGTVTEASNVSYKSGKSIKVEQTYDPSYSGRYHSEVYKTNVYKVGDEGYYGFAFKLHSQWDTSGSQSYNIAQFISNLKDSPENTCSDDWIPSMLMWMEGNQLKIRSKGGNMCKSTLKKFNIGTIQPGQWNTPTS